MSPEPLKAAPLTAAAFAPFGDVLSVKTATIRTINEGHTLRHDFGAALELSSAGGRPALSLFRAEPLPEPLRLAMMERHLLSSQAFYPLSGRPYLVVVAPKGDFDRKGLRAFLAAPDQGVNYHAGTWHHYLLALEAKSDFLVLDRIGGDENCDTIALDPPVAVEWKA